MNKYFYTVNSDEMNQDLCNLELKYLFNVDNVNNCILTDIDYVPNKCVFINSKLSVISTASTLDELCSIIIDEKFRNDDFKVVYMKNKSHVNQHQDRLNAVIKIANAIDGEGCVKNQKITYGVTYSNGVWYFGLYEKTDMNWKKHNNKPHSYSNSLGCDLARSLINLAIINNDELNLVDPCCGIGTVVIEGLYQGINIKGYELNDKIAFNAIENVESFGYQNVVCNMDMNLINKNYDVSIVDIPYGLYSDITHEQQQGIINKCYEISNKLIFVSCEDMNEMLEIPGFKIIDQVILKKSMISSFKRYITVLEK